jgi:hypothetical protein
MLNSNAGVRKPQTAAAISALVLVLVLIVFSCPAKSNALEQSMVNKNTWKAAATWLSGILAFLCAAEVLTRHSPCATFSSCVNCKYPSGCCKPI